MSAETGYWSQIQAINRSREEQLRASREAELEAHRTRFDETRAQLEARQEVISQATDLVIPILRSIEMEAPQIHGSPEHEVATEYSRQEFYHEVNRSVDVFLSGSTVALRWGDKFKPTEEESEQMRRYGQSRIPTLPRLFMMRNIPFSIVVYDYSEISASVSHEAVMINGGNKEGQIIKTDKFLEEPTSILPGLASAFDAPKQSKFFWSRISTLLV